MMLSKSIPFDHPAARLNLACSPVVLTKHYTSRDLVRCRHGPDLLLATAPGSLRRPCDLF
jgi:hypothetical protein